MVGVKNHGWEPTANVEACLCRGLTRVTDSKVFAVRQHQRFGTLGTTDYSVALI